MSYGKAEHWKAVAAEIGRTKPSRAPAAQARRRKKNDGRPPDTSAELLKSKRPKRGPAGAPKTIPAQRITSYRWKDNSCWLDTSLELLYQVLGAQLLASLPDQDRDDISTQDSILLNICQGFEARLHGECDSDNMSRHRDELRTLLHKQSVIKEIDSMQPLLVRSHRYFPTVRQLFTAMSPRAGSLKCIDRRHPPVT